MNVCTMKLKLDKIEVCFLGINYNKIVVLSVCWLKPIYLDYAQILF